MNYRTVFDVTQNGFQGWPFLLFLVGGVLFILVGSVVKTCGEKDSSFKGPFFQLVGAAFALGGLAFLMSSYLELRQYRTQIAEHKYTVAEGVVSKFVPMPPGGHSTESFDVNGVHFAYGSGWGQTSFSSEWNKGFIRDGVQIRVTYVGNNILRIEVH